ncbi:MAG: hypothetical protein LBI69_00810 [Puniceicoccales bacterium]|jgi:hypothetical protein|nr:hypothetical protein [Puniceicoccales bacterium]
MAISRTRIQKLSDLYGESVFRESVDSLYIRDEEFAVAKKNRLVTRFDEECFEKDLDGNLAYYQIRPDGSAAHATTKKGEFVHVIRPDGQHVYLHYSQVYIPSPQVRNYLNTVLLVLGITFEVSHRIQSILVDLLMQADEYRKTLELLDDLYYAASNTQTNFDADDSDSAVQWISFTFLESLVEQDVELPINVLTKKITPQLYHYYFSHLFQFGNAEHKYFFLGPEAGKGKKAAMHTVSSDDCENKAKYDAFLKNNYNLMDENNVLLTNNYFNMENYQHDKPPFSVFDNTFIEDIFKFFGYKDEIAARQYWRVNFRDDGSTYETGADEEFGVKMFDSFAISVCDEKPVARVMNREFYTIKEVLNQQVHFMVSKEELRLFLNSIRVCIEHVDARLQSVINVVTGYMQSMEQSYSVATNTFSIFEEMLHRVARGIR